MNKRIFASLISCCCLLPVAVGLELSNESGVAVVTKVVSAAYLDFKAYLGAQGVAKTDFEKFFFDIDNYVMTVYRQGDFYFVEFVPKRYQGATLRGGASTYRVDPISGAVLSISRVK